MLFFSSYIFSLKMTSIFYIKLLKLHHDIAKIRDDEYSKSNFHTQCRAIYIPMNLIKDDLYLCYQFFKNLIPFSMFLKYNGY